MCFLFCCFKWMKVSLLLSSSLYVCNIAVSISYVYSFNSMYVYRWFVCCISLLVIFLVVPQEFEFFSKYVHYLAAIISCHYILLRAKLILSLIFGYQVGWITSRRIVFPAMLACIPAVFKR